MFPKPDKNSDSFRFLARANNTSEWIWNIYMKYSVVSVVGLAVMSTASVFICWVLHGHFNSDSVYHPIEIV